MSIYGLPNFLTDTKPTAGIFTPGLVWTDNNGKEFDVKESDA